MAKILKHGRNYIEEAQKAYKGVIIQCPECDNTICTSYYYLEIKTDVPCECECGCRFIPEKSDIVKKTGQREGKWIEHIEKPEWLEDDVEVYYECSCCGIYNFGQSYYCPGCGAKMESCDI